MSWVTPVLLVGRNILLTPIGSSSHPQATFTNLLVRDEPKDFCKAWCMAKATTAATVCSALHTTFPRTSARVMGFPGGSVSKEYACNAGDLGLIPESERSPGEGNGDPL